MNQWQDAEHHAERAHRYFESGQLEKALAELEHALEVNPQQSEWHFGMGLTLDALQRHAEAASCFERAVDLQGDHVPTLLRLAASCLQCQRYRRSLGVLRRVQQLDPTEERAYCLEILVQTRLGDHAAAEHAFYMARQIEDECPQCYDYLAQSLAVRSESARAVWCWQRTLQLDPQYPGVRANLACAYWSTGQTERARRTFLEHLRTDPGDTRAMLDMGNLLAELGRPVEAVEKYRRALEIDPTSAEACLRLGELALHNGRLAEAARQLNAAAESAPDMSCVHLRLAEIAQRRGRSELARHHLRRELGRGGRTPEQALDLARLLVESGMPGAALIELDPLVADAAGELSDGQRVCALVDRGVAWTLEGNVVRGIADWRRAVRIEPGNRAALENLARAFAADGRWRRARCCLRRLSRLDPRCPDLRRLHTQITRARLANRVRGLLTAVRQ